MTTVARTSTDTSQALPALSLRSRATMIHMVRSLSIAATGHSVRRLPEDVAATRANMLPFSLIQAATVTSPAEMDLNNVNASLQLIIQVQSR